MVVLYRYIPSSTSKKRAVKDFQSVLSSVGWFRLVINRGYILLSREAKKHYFDKPSELEMEYDQKFPMEQKFFKNFRWSKKKWEKHKIWTYGARNRKSWLHRSPKCSWTSDSCLACFFAPATTRVCQNMRYRLQGNIKSTSQVKKLEVIFHSLIAP